MCWEHPLLSTLRHLGGDRPLSSQCAYTERTHNILWGCEQGVVDPDQGKPVSTLSWHCTSKVNTSPAERAPCLAEPTAFYPTVSRVVKDHQLIQLHRDNHRSLDQEYSRGEDQNSGAESSGRLETVSWAPSFCLLVVSQPLKYTFSRSQ